MYYMNIWYIYIYGEREREREGKSEREREQKESDLFILFVMPPAQGTMHEDCDYLLKNFDERQEARDQDPPHGPEPPIT